MVNYKEAFVDMGGGGFELSSSESPIYSSGLSS